MQKIRLFFSPFFLQLFVCVSFDWIECHWIVYFVFIFIASSFHCFFSLLFILFFLVVLSRSIGRKKKCQRRSRKRMVASSLMLKTIVVHYVFYLRLDLCEHGLCAATSRFSHRKAKQKKQQLKCRKKSRGKIEARKKQIIRHSLLSSRQYTTQKHKNIPEAQKWSAIVFRLKKNILFNGVDCTTTATTIMINGQWFHPLIRRSWLYSATVWHIPAEQTNDEKTKKNGDDKNIFANARKSRTRRLIGSPKLYDRKECIKKEFACTKKRSQQCSKSTKIVHNRASVIGISVVFCEPDKKAANNMHIFICFGGCERQWIWSVETHEHKSNKIDGDSGH